MYCLLCPAIGGSILPTDIDLFLAHLFVDAVCMEILKDSLKFCDDCPVCVV